MSGGTSETFHTAGEQIRKAESKVGERHQGQTPADSEISQLKSIIDSKKAGDIDQAKANLPLPDQPDFPGDLKSADQRTTGSGIGGAVPGAAGTSEADSLRGPASAADSSVRISGDEYKTHTAPGGNVGRQGKEGLEETPKDARAR